jgi:outer membrane protein OmpA-like peptidoglycan-associated protein
LQRSQLSNLGSLRSLTTIFTFCLLFVASSLNSQDLIFMLKGNVYAFEDEDVQGQPLGNVKVRVLGTDGSVLETITDPTGYYEFETDSAGARLINANCAYSIEVSAMEEPASDGNKYLESKGQETTIGVTESTGFIKDFALACADCNTCGGLIPRFPFSDCTTLIENDSINIRDSLDFIVQVLKENQTIELEIIGRCDLFSEVKQNEECAQQRANLVKDYFLRKGMNAARLKTTVSLSEYPFLSDQEFQSLHPYSQEWLKKRSNEVLLHVISFDFEP